MKKSIKKAIKTTACVLAATGIVFADIPLNYAVNNITVAKAAIETYTEGNTTYSYVISGNRAILSKVITTDTTVVIPSTIAGYPVDYIVQYCFQNQNTVENLTIPDGVTTIGKYAFTGMSALKSISIPAGVTTIEDNLFWFCSNLETVEIKAEITSISTGLFGNCEKLQNIIINGEIKSIGKNAFTGCKLLDYTIPSTVESIGNYAFSGSGITNVTLSDTCTSIGDGAFSSCDGIVNVDISNTSLESLPNWIFSTCKNLETVKLPDTLTSLGTYTFNGCTSLAGVDLPSGLTSIGAGSFQECKSIKEITFPAGVTKIENNMFNNSSLETFKMNDAVTEVGDSAFFVCLDLNDFKMSKNVTSIGKGSFEWCEKITDFSLPEGLKTIGDYAFGYCGGLIRATIPSTVTSIGKQAYLHCYKLTSVSIPDGVTSIGNNTFEDCMLINQIQIPDSVTSIGTNVFKNNTTLTVACNPESYAATYAVDNNYATIAFNEYSEYERYTDTTGTYTLKETDGKYTLMNYVSNSKNVTIADSINGKDIVAIADYGMAYCGNIESITIPDTVTDMGQYCLSYNGKLTDIILSKNITYIPERCMQYDESLTTFVIPENIDTIKTSAFDSSGLTSIVIPSNVKNIANIVFLDCANLTNIKFEEGVESLGMGCFRRCNGLVDVKLPNSLNEIGAYTFAECTNLEKIYIPSATTGFAENNVFENTPNVTICAPTTSKAQEYATNNSIAYADIKDELISAFVERMYTVVLGRASEEEGFNVWKNWLLTGEHTAAEMTNAFINSSEFTAKNLSDDEYIDVLYKAVMGRDSDVDGVNSWKAVLSNGVSRNFVLSYFITSSEFTDISNSYDIVPGTLELTENRDKNYNVTSFVQRFYTKVLNRSAEVEGINAWTGYILDKQITPAEAAHVFVFSDEANALNRDDTEFIYMLYRTFMGRECESEDSLNIWLGYLDSYSRPQIFEQFAGSKEFEAIIASYGL